MRRICAAKFSTLTIGRWKTMLKVALVRLCRSAWWTGSDRLSRLGTDRTLECYVVRPLFFRLRLVRMLIPLLYTAKRLDRTLLLRWLDVVTAKAAVLSWRARLTRPLWKAVVFCLLGRIPWCLGWRLTATSTRTWTRWPVCTLWRRHARETAALFV